VPTAESPATERPAPPTSRLRSAAAVLGIALAAVAPGLLPSSAAASPSAGRVVLGSPSARSFADIRAAARPGVLALSTAHQARVPAPAPAPMFGATTTYYALQPDGGTSALVRFRTDGRAHVSRRTVLSPASSEVVVAPTSAVGGVLVGTEASPTGQDVVTVDARGQLRRLTTDGHSAVGLLTEGRRVVYVTLSADGEANGLASVDLAGHGRRAILHEADRDAVLSLPALSRSGRTVFLVRNVFARSGLPQSSLLSVDVATGRVTSRALPGMNYVVSVATSPNGRELAFVGYRAADNTYARWLGFRAEADVVGIASGLPRRVSWVDDPSVVFSRGGSRLIVSLGGRLASVGVDTPRSDPLFGTEGLALPVLAR
jgi:hypothetical protein